MTGFGERPKGPKPNHMPPSRPWYDVEVEVENIEARPQPQKPRPLEMDDRPGPPPPVMLGGPAPWWIIIAVILGSIALGALL